MRPLLAIQRRRHESNGGKSKGTELLRDHGLVQGPARTCFGLSSLQRHLALSPWTFGAAPSGYDQGPTPTHRWTLVHTFGSPRRRAHMCFLPRTKAREQWRSQYVNQFVPSASPRTSRAVAREDREFRKKIRLPLTDVQRGRPIEIWGKIARNRDLSTNFFRYFLIVNLMTVWYVEIVYDIQMLCELYES